MFDIQNFLSRKFAWSVTTFGPGERRLGVLDHMRKEMQEVIDGDGDPMEWVDLVLLATDGLCRSLACSAGFDREDLVGERAAYLIREKQAINEGRTWPDWRIAVEGKAIEHIK